MDRKKQLNAYSVGRITHPKQYRTITPRGAAGIQSFLDNWYNNHRLHGSLDYLTPMEYKEKRKLELEDSEGKNSYEFVTT